MFQTSSTRREFLLTGAALAGASLARGAPQTIGTTSSAADLLDAGLARVEALFPSQNVHRSSHAPMVIEALAVLGRADAIQPWLDENLDREPADARASVAIEPAHWREFAGRPERFADWRAHFLAELRAGDWRTVVRTWAPRFIPWLAGAATHGVIRTGHAARALAQQDNEVRRRALATGLAYWAVNYEELSWDGTSAPEKNVADALARVELRRPVREPPQGNFVTGLRTLRDEPSFRAVAGWIDLRDPSHTLSEMASAFARLYLANPERRVAFTHAITAPSALRLLASHLDEETVRTATRYAWQAAAGLYVVYGLPGAKPTVPSVLSPADVIVRCVENGGAHAIKLTESCLREEALSHDSILLAAARDAAENMAG